MIACGESSPLFIRSFNRLGSLLTRSRWVEIPFHHRIAACTGLKGLKGS